MNRDYFDILKRLDAPLWWDENAVPRYEPFHPDMCSVYCKTVVLITVECQGCTQHFSMAFEIDKVTELDEIREDFSVNIPDDPPRHNCPGDSSTGITVKLEQYWTRPHEDWVQGDITGFEFDEPS